MSTSDAIVKSFKELIVVKLYDKITVADICGKAGISRKSFYAHFVDKYALVEHIIYSDIIQAINELRRLLRSEQMKSASRLITEMIHRNIFDNREFYESLLAHGGEALFVDITSAQITTQNSVILAKTARPKEEREYMAYFYATSHTMLIKKWIQNKFDISPNQLAKYFDTWALSHWAGAINANSKFS